MFSQTVSQGIFSGTGSRAYPRVFSRNEAVSSTARDGSVR
jgi:hypothetical protein